MRKAELRSIRTKLLAANLSTIVFAFSLVAVIVAWSINDLVSAFLRLSEENSHATEDQLVQFSNSTREKISGFYQDAMLRAGTNLIDGAAFVIRPLFLENSYFDVKNYLKETFRYDDRILLASFVVVGRGEVRAWQHITREHTTGLGSIITYDAARRSWVSEVGGQTVVQSDPEAADLIKSRVKSINKVDFSYTDSAGKVQKVAAYDVHIPVIDGPLDEIDGVIEDGAPIGFIRFVLSLEKMQSAIEQEEASLAQFLLEQKAVNFKAAEHTRAIGLANRTRSVLILGASALALLVLAFLISRFLSERLTRPILQLSAGAELIASGNYSQEINVVSDDELGTLGRTFESMRRQVKEFTERLQELVDEKTAKLSIALEQVTTEKKKIQEIMNSIQEGILTFGSSLAIDDSFSVYLSKILEIAPDQIAGRDVIALAIERSDLGEDGIDIVRESLSIIVGEGAIGWHLNSGHLPTEICLVMSDGRKKILGLAWNPMYDADDYVERIMLVIRDLTRQRALEETILAAKQATEKVMTIVALVLNKSVRVVTEFVENTGQRLARLQQLAATQGDQHQIFIDLHTIKGSARTLGFTTLTNLTHAAESWLPTGKQSGALDWGGLGLALGALSLEFDDYRKVIVDILHLGSSSAGNDVTNLPIIVGYQAEDLRKHLEANGQALVAVACNDEVVRWRPEIAKDIAAMVMHAVTNAADHGYIRPAQRGRAAIPARIDVRAAISGARVVLTIADQGYGFDEEKIRAMAIERYQGRLPPANVLEILLEGGLSTAEDVSVTSGRGVGLSAIRTISDRKSTRLNSSH